jgi:glycosyltransferase involved in cell wall biosynthesis
MRVLLVNDYANPGGGAEIQVQLLRRALRERGHDVRLFASAAGNPPPGAADDLCFGTTTALRTPLQAANPSALLRLRQVLAAFRPDVVHVRLFLTQLSPLILPLLRRVPSIWHVAWYAAVCPRGTLLAPDGRDCDHRAGVACLRQGCISARAWVPAMAQLALVRGGLGAFTRIVTLSESARARLAEAGLEITTVMRNGVAERPARPPLTGPPTVAFAGRLVVEKGADILLRAFSELGPDARLLIAGDGPERSRIEALARELGVSARVELAGALDAQALERRFAGAWIHAMPGRWVEPFGNAGAEALMRGTPLVASAPGGAAELVLESGAGAVVARRDVAGLAATLGEWLADRDRCERAGARGREWALANLRHEDHVTRVESLYREVVAEAAR